MIELRVRHLNIIDYADICYDLPPEILASCGADDVLQKALKALVYGRVRLTAFVSSFFWGTRDAV